MVEIPLRIGEPAIVDDIDADTALKYRWTWHRQGRGVVCYLHGQTILLHNLISPKRMVGFKDGNKRNCRRSNLVDAKSVIPERRPSKDGGRQFILVQRKQMRIYVRRNLDRDGVRYRVATNLSFGQKRSFDDTMRIALEKAAEFAKMTRDELIKSALLAKGRRSTNEIVSEWDQFQGRELSNREYFETGLTFSDYEND